MNIAIDLDNTLFKNDVVDNICKKYKVEPPRLYDLTDLPKEVKDECFDAFNDIATMCSLKPFQEGLGIDKDLKDAGHNVYIVTARPENSRTETIKMIETYFSYFDGVYVVPNNDKRDVYKNLDIDIVIDDHIDYINQAKEVGVGYRILVSTDDTVYNHDFIESVCDEGAIVTDSVGFLRWFIYNQHI